MPVSQLDPVAALVVIDLQKGVLAIQTEPPNPLIEWCKQEANAKAPLCRNIGSPRVQR